MEEQRVGEVHHRSLRKCWYPGAQTNKITLGCDFLRLNASPDRSAARKRVGVVEVSRIPVGETAFYSAFGTPPPPPSVGL